MNKFKVGHYTWDGGDVLGQGRLSTIFKGNDDLDQSVVAIKKYNSDMLRNNATPLREILKQEALLLQKFQPQYFVKIKSIEETQNSMIWISEIAEQSLRQRLILQNILSRKDVISLCKDLLSGYLFFHHLNILHQDIRPENILFKNNSYLYSDLGNGYLISQQCGEAQLTPYVSPQLRINQFTQNCDVWSIGIILHECLFGEVPRILQNICEPNIKLDKTDLLHDFILQCIKYSDQERLGWIQVFEHPFVQNELKLNVDLHIEPGFQQFCLTFNQQVSKVDLYLMFGLNSKDNNMNQLSKEEFIIGTKKAVPNQSNKGILDLFYQIAGYQANKISIQDIKNWLLLDKKRLKGLRGYHKDMIEKDFQEYELDNNNQKQILWTRKLDIQNPKNIQLLNAKVIEVLRNIRASIRKFNTNLDELFKKYDPQQIGGINKTFLDKMTKKIYPEGLDDITLSHVFQFLNQNLDGKISQNEFEFCILILDFEKIRK